MLDYQITSGSGTLSAASAVTDLNGNASVNLQLNSIATPVRTSLCVAPSDSPCRILSVTLAQTSGLRLEPVSGTLQVVGPGQSFQAIAMRVIDSSVPSHPVLGASVDFLAYLGRTPGNEPIIWSGETGISQPGMPVILATSQATMHSDINGIANFPLSSGGISGNVAIVGTATAGTSSLEDRKSTRLNSSHVEISYAVFCWKKKMNGTGATWHVWGTPGIELRGTRLGRRRGGPTREGAREATRAEGAADGVDWVVPGGGTAL